MDQSIVPIILFAIFLFLLFNKENYTNFVHYDKSFEKPLITCPENYGKNFERLTKQKYNHLVIHRMNLLIRFVL